MSASASPDSFFVYILRCSDNSLYVGHTANMEERVKVHNERSRRNGLLDVAPWSYSIGNPTRWRSTRSTASGNISDGRMPRNSH